MKGRNTLRFLSLTSDKKLFWTFFGLRFAFLLGIIALHWLGTHLTVISRYGIFSSIDLADDGKTFVTNQRLEKLSVLTVDNSPLLLERDSRLSILKAWDGVHFHHLQLHGYTHENTVVFFPLVPMILQLFRLLLTSSRPYLKVFHLLYVLAPVCFYYSLFNCFLCGAVAVFTRKLLLLTLAGPEAAEASRLDLYASLTPKEDAASAKLEIVKKNLVAVIRQRQRYSAVGSMLDANLFAGDCTAKKDTGLLAIPAYRVIGCSLLYLAISPATPFAILNYTEPLYAALIVVGVYLRAYYRPTINIYAADEIPKKQRNYLFPLPRETKKSVRYEQKWLTSGEILSTLFFFLGSTSRSNAIISVGFVFYPLFIQILLPRLYERRWQMVHAGLTPLLDIKGDANEEDRPSVTGKLTVRTVYTPTRWPSLGRGIVCVLQVLLLLFPYFAVNYFAFVRFAPLWSSEDLEKYNIRGSSGFIKFYAAEQKKFWNVGLFAAWRFEGTGLVFVAIFALVPQVIAVCIHFMRAPVVPEEKRGSDEDSGEEDGVVAGDYQLSLLERSASSSSGVYYLVHLLMSITMVHFQVAFRFSSTCPFLYYYYGLQLAEGPRRESPWRKIKWPGFLVFAIDFIGLRFDCLTDWIIISSLVANLMGVVQMSSFCPGIN
ncbi:Mannosyltransferase (PIG-V), putative [Angomonas deanei]|uniref:GPI mannosyltransferase 2 n=1 Tax=Angomonas deanei TaxID=59799 RepID=A0A7G2CGT0_9TRYP|nr:Mannosyltransferase (PIG-V), putative [Angomonas deanei]